MLQVFIESIAATKLKSLNSIDLYAEQPPWYDNAIFEYLWKEGGKNLNIENKNVPESIQYMLQHCKKFNEADLLVIAAPVWNSSIPAILKAWIDLIISPNHTYRFGADGIEPIHKIKRVLWLISSGGSKEKVNVDNHFLATQQSAFQYIGIKDMDVIWADKQEPALFEDHHQQLLNALDQVKQYTKQLTAK